MGYVWRWVGFCVFCPNESAMTEKDLLMLLLGGVAMLMFLTGFVLVLSS